MTAAPTPYDEFAAPRAEARDDVISLTQYAAMVRRRWLGIVAFVVLGALVGWLLYLFGSKTYAADAIVTLVPTTQSGSRSDIQTTTNTEKTIALSSEVSSRARDRLAASGFYPADVDYRELVLNREVTVPAQTQALEFRFSADRPDKAAAGANAFAEAYLGYRADRASKANKEQIERARAALEVRRNDLAKLDARFPGGAPPGSVQHERDVLVDQIADLRRQEDAARTASIRPGILVDRALEPRGPVAPRLSAYAAGGGFLGLLLGLVNAVRRERADDRIRSGADVVATVRAPLLTSVKVPRSVPANAGLALRTAPDSPEADGYRILAAKLVAPGVRAGRRILITGPAGGDARVAPNVSLALTELGRKVTYVASFDALRTLLQGPGDPPAAEVMSGRGQAVPVASVPGLEVAPLQSDALAEGVSGYLDEHNVVIVDGSDLAGAWQVLALAGRVDSTVLVVDPRRSGRRTLGAMVTELRSVSAALCGSVRLVPAKIAAPPEGAGRAVAAPRRSSGALPERPAAGVPTENKPTTAGPAARELTEHNADERTPPDRSRPTVLATSARPDAPVTPATTRELSAREPMPPREVTPGPEQLPPRKSVREAVRRTAPAPPAAPSEGSDAPTPVAGAATPAADPARPSRPAAPVAADLMPQEEQTDGPHDLV